MSDDENLATIFEQISSVEKRYNDETKKIDLDDLISVVLDAAPKNIKQC